MSVLSRAGTLDTLDLMGAVGGYLNGAKVILIKAAFIPSNDLLLADVVEADFNGYAPSSAVTWLSSYWGPDGQAHLIGSTKLFEATDGLIPNTIFGWGLTNAAGTELLMSGLLDDEAVITQAGDGLPVTPDYIWGQ